MSILEMQDLIETIVGLQRDEDGMKLIANIMDNIINNLSIIKYRSISIDVLQSKLNKHQKWFNLLQEAGFHRSNNGKQLTFDINRMVKLKCVKNILEHSKKQNAIIQSIYASKSSREKGKKLLHKIINNILSNPTKVKYQSINLNLILSKLNNDYIWIKALMCSGFKISKNGERLLFNTNEMFKLKHMQKALNNFVDGKNKIHYELCQTSDDQQDFSGEELKINNDTDEDEATKLAVILHDNENLNQQLNQISSNINHTTIETENINENLHLLSCSQNYIHKHKCDVTLEKCDHLDRICYILSNYQKYIDIQLKYNGHNDKMKQNIVTFVYGVYADFYDNMDLLNDFNHLITYHANQFERIYNILHQKIYNGKVCDLRRCLLLRRNQRDRENTNENKNLLAEMFFTNNTQEIVLQEILDRIHCYYSHSFDIGYRIMKSEQEAIINQQLNTKHNLKNEENSNSLTYDKISTGISKLIHSKMKQNASIDGLDRLYPDKMTREKWKPGDKVEIFSDSQKKWFIGTIEGQFNDEQGEWLVVKYDGNTTKEIQRFNEYIRAIQKKKAETKCMVMKGIEAMDRQSRLDAYKYGFRFFYWYYYKDKTVTHDDARVLSKTVNTIKHDANTGYTVGELYVTRKYASFKDEMLQNDICGIKSILWDQLVGKSKCYINTDHYKEMRCTRGKSAQNYEMKHGENISESHLIAMMVYCGCDDLQRRFTETFRRLDDKESIHDVKNRHSNYYFFGRLLRECVECFGMKHENKSLKVYHGTNKKFLFESLFAFVKSPFSTTKIYSVAVNFSGNMGNVLELTIHPKSWLHKFDEGLDALQTMNCFDCTFLSEYPAEQEIFCVGGLNRFEFNNIYDAKTNINYQFYIKGLIQMTTGMTHGGISADALSLDIPGTGFQKNMVFRLLSHQFNKYLPDHHFAAEFKDCPKYFQEFMDSHCRNVKTIHVLDEKNEIFDLFFRLDNSWIKLNELTTIFPNVEHIQYYAHFKNISFSTSPVMYDSILTFIQDNINNTKRKLPRFSILVNPKFQSEIQQTVAKYQNKFELLNWRIWAYATDVIQAWGMNTMLENAKMDKEWGEAITKFMKTQGWNELGARFVNGANRKDFNILKHHCDLDTLCIQIEPMKRNIYANADSMATYYAILEAMMW